MNEYIGPSTTYRPCAPAGPSMRLFRSNLFFFFAVSFFFSLVYCSRLVTICLFGPPFFFLISYISFCFFARLVCQGRHQTAVHVNQILVVVVAVAALFITNCFDYIALATSLSTGSPFSIIV